MRKAKVEKLPNGLFKCLICNKDDLKSKQAAGGHFSKLHRRKKTKTKKTKLRHSEIAKNLPKARVVTVNFCSTCGERIPNAVIIEGKTPTPVEITINYCSTCGERVPNAIIRTHGNT